MSYLDRTTDVARDNVLHLTSLLNFSLVAHVTLSHPLNCGDNLLVLGVWIGMLEWIFLLILAFADLEFEDPLVGAVSSSVRASSETSASVIVNACLPLGSDTEVTPTTLAGVVTGEAH